MPGSRPIIKGSPSDIFDTINHWSPEVADKFHMSFRISLRLLVILGLVIVAFAAYVSHTTTLEDGRVSHFVGAAVIVLAFLLGLLTRNISAPSGPAISTGLMISMLAVAATAFGTIFAFIAGDLIFIRFWSATFFGSMVLMSLSLPLRKGHA